MRSFKPAAWETKALNFQNVHMLAKVTVAWTEKNIVENNQTITVQQNIFFYSC